MSPVERSNSSELSTGHGKREITRGISKGLQTFGDTSIYPKDIYTNGLYTNGLCGNFMNQMPATSYTLTSANML